MRYIFCRPDTIVKGFSLSYFASFHMFVSWDSILTKNYLYLLNLFLRDMSCSNNWADFARSYLANIYLFKVNNGNTMQCVKFVQLTIKGPDRGHWRRSGVFTVNCEQISDTVLVVSIVEFEQVYASWEIVKGRMRCEIFLSRHFMKY